MEVINNYLGKLKWISTIMLSNSLKNLRCGVLWIASVAIFNPQFAAAQSSNSFPEIQLNITNHQFNSLQKSKGSKLKLNNAILTLNGDTAIIKDIHLRGNNTLYFKRKSLSIDLEKSLPVTIGNQNIHLKKFHLLNLSMDKNLWHNRWSYLILADLGLFPSFHSFCLLSINRHPQGIYLLVEKPQQATANRNSPYTIRRGIKHTIDHDYAATKSKDDLKKFKKQYYSLYETSLLHGDQLYEHLSASLNLELYFRWLAFNYLIMNGDYADELFLYINPATQLFDVMAWDYDDLFMSSPHEGRLARNQEFKERLIYSLEDELDYTIAADDFVYGKYIEVLKTILTICSDELMDEKANQVLLELTQMSGNHEDTQATMYVDKEPFKIEEAKYDINKSIEFLKKRRAFVLEKIFQQ